MLFVVMRWILLLIAIGCYSLSLDMPAYREASIEGYRLRTGFECLFSPMTITPAVLFIYPSWFANPLLYAAIVCFCFRWDASAGACSCFAILFALLFIVEAIDLNNNRIEIAFWFWLASMSTIAIGSILLVLVRARIGYRGR